MHDFNVRSSLSAWHSLPPTNCSSRDSSAHDDAAPSAIDDSAPCIA